jgi:hypothetical protein
MVSGCAVSRMRAGLVATIADSLAGLPPCPFGIIVLSIFLVARIPDLKRKPG